MGMGAITSHRWTVEEYHALPETPGQVLELLDGELLVSPAPRRTHQRAIAVLFESLLPFVRALGAEMLMAPEEVSPDPWTAVQPDLLVLPLVNGRIAHDHEQPVPLLLVEVLSPSTARIDRGRKRLLYQRLGVEYWIVDLDARLVEQWMPDAASPVVCHEVVDWAPIGAPAPIRLALPEFFGRVVPVDGIGTN